MSTRRPKWIFAFVLLQKFLRNHLPRGNSPDSISRKTFSPLTLLNSVRSSAGNHNAYYDTNDQTPCSTYGPPIHSDSQKEFPEMEKATVKVSPKFQVVIPKLIREELEDRAQDRNS